MTTGKIPLPKVETESPDVVLDKIEQLKELFPETVTEGKVDLAKLRQLLGEEVDDRPERYSFTWAGKNDALRLLRTPSRATLIPAPEESVDFETTANLFIEGDNLEVLKLLYKSFSGRVKMIYIDPPYNTGNDFIYPDNFTDPLSVYLQLTGQKDAEGNLLTSNPETSGRFHSKWLSMIYPRLWIARQLLSDDGVIFVSIDDHEVYNLRMVLNEVFGEENLIAELAWEKGRKNDAKLFSVGHEYLLVFAKNLSTLKGLKTIWREPKPGAQEIWDTYCRLRKEFEDDESVERELQDWYHKLPDTHPSKRLSRYRHVDKHGPWRDRDVSWPGGGGPRYDVIHPVTKQPCKVPEAGWRFATADEMQRQIQLGLVVFREDHTNPPFRKAHLRPVFEELDDDENASINGGEDDSDANGAVGLQVMPSVIYKQSQVAVKYLRNLMGAKVFDNPKDHEIIGRLVRYVVEKDKNSLILDYFAGSCPTAQAVMELNHEDGGNRRFIMVQFPEPTPKGSVAHKQGYSTIAEIGKDRIRRVTRNLKNDKAAKLPLFESGEDLGFKVFKLAESHFRPWRGVEKPQGETVAQQVALFTDPLVKGWKAIDVIYEVALKEGYSLNCCVEKAPSPTANTIYQVTDPEREQSFRICLDGTLNEETIRALSLSKDDIFVCRDVALTDDQAANLALQCRLKVI